MHKWWRRLGMLFFVDHTNSNFEFGGYVKRLESPDQNQLQEVGVAGEHENSARIEITASMSTMREPGGDWDKLESVLAHESAAQLDQREHGGAINRTDGENCQRQDLSQTNPRSFVFGGDDTIAKTAMLLQYAYNAALRGCRSFILTRQPPAPSLQLPGGIPSLIFFMSALQCRAGKVKE